MEKRVGFLGLGAMGKPMAERLVKAGYEVIVCAHRNQEVVDELVRQGARRVSDPAEMAAEVEVAITMLPDSPQVEAVCFGPRGLVEGKVGELTIIDMSTISPLATRSLAERLSVAGVVLLDAPVSGGIWRAASGELTIMVGGEEEQVERWRSLLNVLGTRVLHVGTSGQGALIKVINNVIVGMLLPAISEALTLGVKAGASLDTIRDVISTSSGNSYVFEHWLPNTLFQENFEGGFALELMRKDIGLALEVGRELDVPLPEASLAYQLFTQAKGLGYSREDMTAVSKIYQQSANINIVTGQPYTTAPASSAS